MKIEVLDTTLRDGAQAEGVTLSIDDKAECIRLFDDLKIDYIEAGTPFANPQDKKLLCDDDVKTINSHLVAFGSTRHKNNLTDEDSALNLLSLSKTQFVSVVGKSSVTQAEKVLQVSAQDNLKMIYDSIRFLCDRNKTVFFDAEHFFDGYKENPDYALDTLRTAKNAGAKLLVLCDTNGATLPEEISAIVKTVVKTFKRAKSAYTATTIWGLPLQTRLRRSMRARLIFRALFWDSAKDAETAISSPRYSICNSKKDTISCPKIPSKNLPTRRGALRKSQTSVCPKTRPTSAKPHSCTKAACTATA